MKIGDTVRFLSEVGGGKVSGFQGKDIVLVEDEDGFEIPMLKKDVVLVTDDSKMTGEEPLPKTKANKQAEEQPKKPQPAAPPTFHRSMERKGAEQINLYLSFVPNEVKEISTTSFEAYFVNDSNYYMQVLYMCGEDANWHARFNAVVEPNSKVFVEEFDRSVLNDMSRICIQTLAWKQDKPFALKPAQTVEIRLDCTKFYKLHTFQPNEFFTDPNWTLPVIRDDKPVRSIFVNAEELQEALVPSIPSHVSKKDNTDGRKMEERTKKGGKGADSIQEVDLHIEKLLDNTAGLSNADMLLVQMKEFRRVMDENIKKPGAKIVVIHGKGNGVLRKTILQELKYRYKSCTWQDASFMEYGYGATQITVHNAK